MVQCSEALRARGRLVLVRGAIGNWCLVDGLLNRPALTPMRVGWLVVWIASSPGVEEDRAE